MVERFVALGCFSIELLPVGPATIVFSFSSSLYILCNSSGVLTWVTACMIWSVWSIKPCSKFYFFPSMSCFSPSSCVNLVLSWLFWFSRMVNCVFWWDDELRRGGAGVGCWLTHALVLCSTSIVIMFCIAFLTSSLLSYEGICVLLSFSRSSSFSRNYYLYYLIMFYNSAVYLLFDSADLPRKDLGLLFELLAVKSLVGDCSIAKSNVFS